MIAIQKPQTIGPSILPLQGERAGVRASYSLAKPLIENHNVVPSFSPGLAAQRPTPGKSHKIQPLIPKPREARIRIAANSPKIQNWFPHPQTNPRLTSTFSHPKSTVDLGCEPLIKVENGLRSPLSPTCYRPKSGPKIKESNQNQTVTNRKILSRVAAPMAVPKDCCGVRSCALTSSSIKSLKPIQGYSSLLQSIQAFLPPHPGGHMVVVLMVALTQSVTAGRAWSRPFKKKKIVYFL